MAATPTNIVRLSNQVLVGLLVLLAGAPCAPAAEEGGQAPRRDEPELPQLPGVKADRKNKLVDIEGKIILPLQSDWLELLACAPKSREHESIISLSAKPSHIHGALMLIGLKPGSPLRAEKVGDEWKYHPPTGPRIAVSIRYEKDGKTVEVPANEWILDQKTRKELPDNIWLFTGSKIYEAEGKSVYIADLEGNILSLVNFGNEVLARNNNKRGGQDGGGNDAWAANSKVIPPTGTKIVVRLKPVPDEPDDKKK